MRIAFFSPLPPAKSGIADYSAALLDPLRRLAQVEAFTDRPPHFNPAAYDVCVYQIGNNPHHIVPYEMALEHPGVVVLHEANLHHLITDLTIRRNDWPAYLNEVEYNGGATALAYARRYVATLERGPDYDGVPMLRRIVERSLGVIVHSDCVGEQVRKAGYEGPLGRIWHGGWVLDSDRNSWRFRLGLDELTPLIGVFGFLKPYKRIAESLRAFRRLLRVEPRARMILVGEPHPELQLDSLIDSLDLAPAVRVLGFTPIEDFNGYIGACDIVLNLRYPTVGESSGTLLRALGLGRAVVVSDVGSFREYPDDVVLKTPVDSTEEDHLFEYLNLLVSRPDYARKLGANAREWVRRECSWDVVAGDYVEFLEAVRTGAPVPDRPLPPVPEPPPPAPEPAAPPSAPEPAAEAHAREIRLWTAPEARDYAESHITRLARTLEITPRGTASDRILEMGAYLQITPALKTQLGYGEVRGCYYGKAGRGDLRRVTSSEGVEFECKIDLFDAEKDVFPYENEHFSTVLCCELIEHLFSDPMHLMSEANRILKIGGHLVLTTPNIASLRAIAGLLQGFQPGLFPAYIRPRADGETDARHNREYTPREISDLFENSGFTVTLLDTGPFLDEPHPEFGWVRSLLDRYILSTEHRGDGIYAVGRKIGPIRDRYPSWLYA
ncbi:MAG: glycosyltransferase [Acidobacteria bacterium]|nr:glycosyltransferase [Acidobacteriota bacterium]